MARAGRRHPGVPERRARDPRNDRVTAQTPSEGLRSTAAVLAPLAGRAATRVQAVGPSPRRACDQCRRDFADGARHTLRHRHGRGAHQPLQSSQPTAATAHRENLAGFGESACRPLWACGAGHRDPALFGGRLPCAAGIHRAGDPAHEPRGRHPADARAQAGRHRGLSLRRAARWALHARRTAHAARAGSAVGRGHAHRHRPAPRQTTTGSASRAHPARRGSGARARGSGDHRFRAFGAGPARPPGRQTNPGRSETRACFATSSRISCRC